MIDLKGNLNLYTKIEEERDAGREKEWNEMEPRLIRRGVVVMWVEEMKS